MFDAFDERSASRIDLRLESFRRQGRFALWWCKQTILVLLESFEPELIRRVLSFFSAFIHSEFLIALLVENLSTEVRAH